MGVSGPAAPASVDHELAAVLPKDNRPWWKQRHLLKLNLSIGSVLMFSSANGFDGTLMNSLQALTQWNDFMDHPTGEWLGFINAIYWLGVAICFPPAAYVANKWGRKPGVWVGVFFLVLGSVLQTAANNVAAFVLARLLIGVASSWVAASIPILVNEIAYPTHRGIVNALYNCGWHAGSIVAAWICYGTRLMDDSWSWRLPSVFQLLLPAFAIPGLLAIPESPRWLISMDRTEEARSILSACHGAGDTTSPLVAYEVAAIEEAIRADKLAGEKTSYADMFKTPGNRRRLFITVTLAIFAQWTGNGVVSYYLALVLNSAGVTNVSHQLLISGCLQIWNLIFSVLAAVSVDKLGRRMLFLSSASIELVAYVIITGLSGSFAETGASSVGLAVVPFLFIFYAGYDIALTPLLVAYPCEIWPFQLRSKGNAVNYVTTVSAIFFNTFVNPIALDAIGWKYYIVFIVFIILYGITAYFWYPETKGLTLERIAIIFDGDEAVTDPTMGNSVVGEKEAMEERLEMVDTESK
ncbi:Sugar/inositol transporter [Macrophomina phaseolina MS6]|uniref:Sugar/inositol transporter n=1 Tax=Macrophomina phaseolina (strain MS6) TaxID=1126212 RepID=K2S0N8_MACPH|nr:Sugar/inositol transporter [Macrophomina phaseolina MS6]